MNLSLGKIIASAYGTITRRLYLHTAIVATFLLIVISITIWAGNTLTMITAIARFERTHTVSRVEAMVALLKFLEFKKPGDLEVFQAKMAITQSYNKLFSRLLDMRNDTSDAEFARILESTFSETDHRTAVIIVNRIKVLYWHPILKELVAYAVGANAAGEKIELQVAQILAANNEVERTALFAEIEKTEKELIFCETSFSKHCSELSNQISTYVNSISIVLLIFSVGFTGLLTYMLAKTVLEQATRYTSDLEKEIQERKQVEEELLESKTLVEAVVENVPLMIFLKEATELRFVLFNRAGEELVGYDREIFLEKNDLDFFPPEQAATFMAKDREVLDIECGFVDIPEEPIMTAKQGLRLLHTRKVRVRGDDGVTKYVLGISEDITDRKKTEEEKHALEQQFQHTQKLESLGVLSGGIAHDFNNILAIIMGYCSLTKMDYETAENNILEIEKAAERAAALCRQMLAYAGKAQLTKSQVNMGMLVDEMVTMLKSTLPQNAVIKPDLSTDIPCINADASQLRQIVMNLIINASEAIGKEQGEIRVSLAKTAVIAGQADKDYHGKTIPPGEYLSLEVTDNGCGMDEETKWRIFEPFYTTKFSGRGLGMSAVIGIIMSHGGAMQLFSEVGKGTTFKVYLPVSLTESPGIESTTQAAPPAPWQGSGTILLVEDEDQVRLLAKKLLARCGFTVLEAANGKEALELYRQNSADILLVFTDMGMPVMDGYQLFHELKRLNSNLPIIISSGFGDAEVGSRIGIDRIAGLISKPYRSDQLREVLKGVVERSPSATPSACSPDSDGIGLADKIGS